MADDFTRLEPWLAGLAAKLTPGQTIRLARKVGQSLRRANAQRIAANVKPDGDAMEPRKKRRRDQRRAEERAGRVRKKGKMFPKIRLVRNMRVKPTAADVSIGFTPQVARAASVHHYGLRDRVARFRGAPEVRYPARPLLGFGKDDVDAIATAALNHLKD